MKSVYRLLIALCGLLVVAGAWAADSDLVTEMATEHVDITARFTGQDVLIFGAMSRPGEVVVKVVSPPQTVDLSRKAKFGPFWLTSGKMTVTGAPGLYYVLSSAPLDGILSPAARQRYGFALEDGLSTAKASEVPADMADWRQAFLDLQTSRNYYVVDGHAVTKVGNRLFSASMKLPAKLPLGSYDLEIYLVHGGKVVAQQTHRFDVREVHMERWVSDVAYSHSWLFGALFTVLAMALGLGLGMALRRGSNG